MRRFFALMDVEILVPDHTTLARRRRSVAIDMHTSAHPKPVDIVLDSTGLKFYGPGEWDRAKHGERRRAWRKLHVSNDPAISEIVAHQLTDSDTSDAAMPRWRGRWLWDLEGTSDASLRMVHTTANR